MDGYFAERKKTRNDIIDQDFTPFLSDGTYGFDLI